MQKPNILGMPKVQIVLIDDNEVLLNIVPIADESQGYEVRNILERAGPAWSYKWTTFIIY